MTTAMDPAIVEALRKDGWLGHADELTDWHLNAIAAVLEPIIEKRVAAEAERIALEIEAETGHWVSRTGWNALLTAASIARTPPKEGE